MPLAGQAGDRGGGQPRARAEELFQGRDEIAPRQPVQTQQRQHLADLRGLTRPGWQDRRGKPLQLTRIGVNTAVVDPGRAHRDRPGGGQHLAGMVIAVTHYQPVTIFVSLTGELVYVGGDLGLQALLQTA